MDRAYGRSDIPNLARLQFPASAADRPPPHASASEIETIETIETIERGAGLFPTTLQTRMAHGVYDPLPLDDAEVQGRKCCKCWECWEYCWGCWVTNVALPVHTLVVAALQVILYYVANTRETLAIAVPVAEGQEWRLLTLILAHADEVHLWSNTVALLLFGGLFEMANGSIATFVVYWGSGLFASAMEVVLWSRECVVFLGGSGAVYGLIGALLGELLLNWNEAYALLEPAKGERVSRCRRCLGACTTTTLRVATASLIAFVVVVEGVLHFMSDTTGVARGAHFFGGVYGAAVALFAAHNAVVHRWELWINLLAFTTAIAAACVAAILVAARVAEWRDREEACTT